VDQLIEVPIPSYIKPMMDKEVNFQLYCDMLMQKIDKQRVFITPNAFIKLKFENFGFPEVMIRLFAFLSQESTLSISIKKARQHFLLENSIL